MKRFHGAIIAFGAALIGASLLQVLGVPAGALVGATLAVAVCALGGLRPSVPDLVRNAAFAVIGVSLGAGITSDFLTDIARWPASLIGLTLTMLAIMVASGALLTRVFHLDRATAALSSSPGALSYAVAIAANGTGDPKAVVALQSLRLLLVTLCLPLLIGSLAGTGAGTPFAMSTRASMGPVSAAAIIATALAAGWGLDRLRVPAPYLIAGLAISGVAHYLGWVTGGLAPAVLFAGFMMTGAVIGSRFTRVARSDLAHLVAAGVTMTALSVSISALGAALVSGLTGLKFAAVWVAFAPGGVEGMAAIGLALGLDPAYIATHHIFRILLVIALLPMLLRRSRA